MLRGTGIRGLAGIHPRIIFKGGNEGEVVRPLLGFRRTDLEAFLRDGGQSWREDSTNSDPAFLRNRVRHRVLPLLKEEFGAVATENLADLAEIARAEEEHWQSGHPETRVYQSDSHELETLAASSIQSLPVAAQRRLIRGWLEAHASDMAFSFRMIEEVRDLALGPAGRKLELHGGRSVRRTQRELCLEETGESTEACGYEYRLPVPGSIAVPELGLRVEAIVTEPDVVPPEDRASLLNPARLPQHLLLRNWRPGDRYWPAHTKREKKVKELLGDRHLTGAQKKLWPVAVAQDWGLVWVRGFPAPAAHRPICTDKTALWIRLVELK
jgi:tRNA(Ile)-lysidine synthase